MEIGDCRAGEEVSDCKCGSVCVGLMHPGGEDTEVGVSRMEEFAVSEQEIERVDNAAAIAGECYVADFEVGEEGGDKF